MILSTLWFAVICILFCGFFFLEGFDFGVGTLVKIIGKTDIEKRTVINSIGPVWDTNEVWLLTAGGATFAAFPGWYATMFSGMYPAFFLVLIALIARGVSFEFRSKVQNEKWRNTWDNILTISSVLLPLLFGIALADLLYGLPLNNNGDITGNFFDLLPLPSIFVGITTLALFSYHGAVYLTLKLEDNLLKRAFDFAKKIGPIVLIMTSLTLVLAFLTTDILKSTLAVILAVLAVLSLVGSYLFIKKNKAKLSMILNSITIVSSVCSLFIALFSSQTKPSVMVSSIERAYNLTIASVSSTPYTLNVMTIVAATVLPIVLGYIIWTYWVFRKRISSKKPMEY